ncbi:RNA polymerase III transcription factor IIIC subunit-domain-containing protein [Apodospora peruviana]|uniref:RNA polymerase III transcription factor IIIC subunit-domain-containing protein n=1 Tax=Apodospora peruviana TaxID=516989 RepID=A0AAE0MBT1_9PEZI|nr:RNA polymerase III transcription factor IIIC subunit-domain-containing protein [Apodospora peruviana]
MAAPIQGAAAEHAPTYPVPTRRLAALEHPMIVKDLDKAIKTFGQNYALEAIVDSTSPQISVPLYLRYDNPTVRPLTSHNAPTHNVVLKVTVPKRTGRKRKRGTNGPFEGEIVPPKEEVVSKSRLDAPKVLRRKLCDTVGKYTVEPIGVVKNTHRYRGMADFQYAMGSSKFMSKFVDKVLPGDVAKLKEFTLQPGIETGSNIDLVPPPYFTPMSLPFGYNYTQNPYTKEVSPGPSSASGSVSEDHEYTRVVNVTTRVPAAGYFIAHDEYPVPTGPRRQPDMSDPQVEAIMTEMWRAMEERPIWTRRSMWNRLGAKFSSLPKSGSLVRHCLQYAGYQFKGGPWRDALVRYGLDPRSDPKYRKYQTLIFKLHKTRIGSVGRSWQAVRRREIGVMNFGKYWQEIGDDEGPRDTHIFNGVSFSADGKVWQVCDITDPLLARLFESAEVRSECDVEIGGFYHRVLWSVAKAIMKCKMLAIRFGRTLTDDDFGATLDAVKGPNDGGDGGGTSIGITLPDLQLTAAECEQLRGKKMKPGLKPGRDRWEEKRKKTHYRVRIPLKETEEREAEKMIRLLSNNTGAAPQVDGGAGSEVASLQDAQRQPHDAGMDTTAAAGGGQDVVDFGTEMRDRNVEEDKAVAFQQELLDDLDEDEEEDSEDEESGAEDEEEEDDDEDGVEAEEEIDSDHSIDDRIDPSLRRSEPKSRYADVKFGGEMEEDEDDDRRYQTDYQTGYQTGAEDEEDREGSEDSLDEDEDEDEDGGHYSQGEEGDGDIDMYGDDAVDTAGLYY